MEEMDKQPRSFLSHLQTRGEGRAGACKADFGCEAVALRVGDEQHMNKGDCRNSTTLDIKTYLPCRPVHGVLQTSVTTRFDHGMHSGHRGCPKTH